MTATAVHTEARRPQAAGFRPDIEGLRAVAVLLVVLAHAGVPGLTGGFVGVDVFFVISGFLITGLLLRELKSTGRVSIARFYARRAARLLPASTVVLIATVIGSWLWLSPIRVREFALDALASAFYVSNVRFAVTGTDYLNNDATPSPFQHFWSLAVEEQFYLVWPPLILVTILLARRRRWVAVALAALIAVSLVLSVTETARSAPWAYFGAHTRMWELGAGAMLALVAGRLRRIPGPWALGLGGLGLAAVLTAAIWYDAGTPFPGTAATLPVAGAVLLIAAGSRPLPLLTATPMQHLGRLSYGWYLWHWPVLLIGPAALGLPSSLWLNLGLCAGALVLAELSYRFVETPIRHRPSLRSRPVRGIGLGLALSAVVAAVALTAAILPPAIPVGAAAPDVRTRLASGADPAGELRTLIASAATAARLPANATPPLADAARSIALPQTDGCHLSFTATAPDVPCEYGDPAGSATVVLYGDSHALQWFPALQRLALDQHWKLVSLTKSSCLPADVAITNTKLKRVYTECATWREASLRRIAALRPDLVVVTSSVSYRGVAVSPATVDAQWRTGWDRTLTRLRAAAGHVVHLVDTPTLTQDVLGCLATHPDAIGRCASPTGPSLREPGWRAGLAALARRRAVTVIDPNPWLCADTCPAVLGNAIVYRDANHLTAPFAESLAPLLAARLPAI